MKYYRVYGSVEGGRFKALDVRNMEFVSNLIHATFFNESQLEQANNLVDELNELNEDMVFEVRLV